jgi:hypothetical protein
MGYRFKMLTQRAYQEAGMGKGPEGKFNALPLFPKWYMDNFNDISFDKIRDFNFIGVININQIIKENRQWVIDFAKQHFTEKSYFRLNSNEDLEQHESLGEFDDTFSYEGKRRVDKYMRLGMRRCKWDEDYFGIMCSSEFTLCPAGDSPRSDRFFESIMSKSIPILEKPDHSGNKWEQTIGYKFYLFGDDFEYRQDWVDYNYDLFLKTHTLFAADK